MSTAEQLQNTTLASDRWMNSLYARPSHWARYKTAVEAGEGKRWHLASSSSSLIFKLDTIRWISLTSTDFYQFVERPIQTKWCTFFIATADIDWYCYRSSVRQALQCPWLSPCSPSLGPSPSRVRRPRGSRGNGPWQQPMGTMGKSVKIHLRFFCIVYIMLYLILFNYIYIVIVLPSEFYEN